jgi:hypothetical protein
LSFYHGDRTRILIAVVILGLAILNLMWFAAAIASVLRYAGVGGWGLAAVAASAAVSAVFLAFIAVNAALAYSVAGRGATAVTSGLNDLSWAGAVLAAFPAAMLVMATAFGTWRAGIITSSMFNVGVAAVVLTLLGGTTWASNGFWAPDGTYTKIIAPIIGLAWLGYISVVLTSRVPYSQAEAQSVEVDVDVVSGV